jgi:glycerate 2-kinase
VNRIQNIEALTAHGNVKGRQAVLAILEAGLQAADPYNNTRRLLRLEGGRLHIGRQEFQPRGSPWPAEEAYDLSQLGRIYVVGAGKGVQRVAQAIEDVLGERLTGGHVIDKRGGELTLRRIGVTWGAHPVPDEQCVAGCERILEVLQGLRPEDLVFTIAANGVSALLTMPVPGVSLEDVRRVTYLMQIARGAPTGDLNPVRNHLDRMKGGRLSAHIAPARAVHLVAVDPGDYQALMQRNLWLHNLPDCTDFRLAVRMLEKWDAWDDAPASVRTFLRRADPRWETIRAEAFDPRRFRIYGVMPNDLGVLPAARARAAELGLTPITLASWLTTEAAPTGEVIGTIAVDIARRGQPFAPPCALFTSGELVVTVGEQRGIGGRNQEYALAAAHKIAGSPSIVVGAVDTDGTDGPGGQFAAGREGLPALAGGLTDGYTAQEALSRGVDIHEELRQHNATPALCRLDSGIVASPNISLCDLGVTVILASDQESGP